MKVLAKRIEGGFLIPTIKGLEDRESIEVEIVERPSENITLSDEYIKNHWKELVVTKSDDSEYYKSLKYYIDRADYEKER